MLGCVNIEFQFEEMLTKMSSLSTKLPNRKAKTKLPNRKAKTKSEAAKDAPVINSTSSILSDRTRKLNTTIVKGNYKSVISPSNSEIFPIFLKNDINFTSQWVEVENVMEASKSLGVKMSLRNKSCISKVKKLQCFE